MKTTIKGTLREDHDRGYFTWRPR